MHIKDIVKDVKHWMSFIPYKPVEDVYRAGFMAGLTIPPYELPDGTKINNNEKICTAAERWFLPENKINSSSSSSSSSSSVVQNTTSSTVSSNNFNNGSSVNSSSSSSSNRGNNSHLSTNKMGLSDSKIDNNNNVIDNDKETLQSLVHHCISMCDNDVRKDLLANIVIVGGGSLIDGVSNRLTYELNELIPSTMKVNHFITNPTLFKIRFYAIHGFLPSD